MVNKRKKKKHFLTPFLQEIPLNTLTVFDRSKWNGNENGKLIKKNVSIRMADGGVIVMSFLLGFFHSNSFQINYGNLVASFFLLSIKESLLLYLNVTPNQIYRRKSQFFHWNRWNCLRRMNEKSKRVLRRWLLKPKIILKIDFNVKTQISKWNFS